MTIIARAARRTLMLILLGCAATQAAAATYSCIGKVEQVTADLAGNVNVSFAFQSGTMAWQLLCNVNQADNQVPPTACKAMLATLLAARLSQQNVQMWFNNDTGGSCDATPWKHIKDMGWYWGPSL